jgi:phospholipid transport system substrate-binding protein
MTRAFSAETTGTAMVRVFGASSLTLVLPLAAFVLSIFLVAGSARAAAPDAESDPVAFLQVFSDRAIAMLADDSLSKEERAREFRSLLQSGFDMERIGRAVLGRYWRSATPEQRAEFLKLFEEFVVLFYADRLSDYSGETLQIGKAHVRGDRDALVRSRVLRPDRPAVAVDWRLRRTAEGWRIVDVMIEGVSMTITHRSEFAAVISNSPGRIEGLLQKLREKTKGADVGA